MKMKNNKSKNSNKWWEDKKYYPTEEEPRYGECFQIKAIQTVKNIDGYYSKWILCNFDKNELIPVGKNWGEWRKRKQKISDDMCKIFNWDKSIKVPIKDVVALKVHYLGDPAQSHQIL